jgi:hypothetical protein
MGQHKHPNSQIADIAKDLGLQAGADPFRAILGFCEARVEEFFPPASECESLLEFLSAAANYVGTKFLHVNSSEDLVTISREYLNRKENGFAILESELAGEVYGITFKLQAPIRGELKFVSVIDCRGTKAARAYFTKWHEVAHLLTLTEPMRSVFRRTHPERGVHDPEERLMDAIAGKFGFFAGVTRKYIEREISFNEIDRLRMLLCHEASRQAALINFVKYWPTPCIHLRAEVGLSKAQKAWLYGKSIDSIEYLPEPAVRAVRVVPNEQARSHGFLLFDGLKIPERSVIYRMFMRGHGYEEAVEDLSWWGRPTSGPIRVKAKATAGSVEALIIPCPGRPTIV